ncbi:extracellular solute-binding protein [Waterburya agarophytonicola K14]|uniref:Extracellular solute-binding protein n=1 Tax=Waterburya agarophytonicola KI4 TaxID=2874699 RepID=A0A964BML1_9CYAN|nr:extracellular solute-binding protein [Waterburya agarophytonicola]MCC0175462.1 extracellular solute-binding protein [Waterburya agarophytonicola KI4]
MNYQLSRRSFIQLASTTALSQLLMSCSNSDDILQILFLANSIPIQLIGDFRKTVESVKKVDFQPQTQWSEIFDSLLSLSAKKATNSETKNLFDKIFNKSKNTPDVISLGDSWLSLAIEQNLLKPLDIDSLANWEKLPLPWQKLVRRDDRGNVTTDGQIYGAPYRWGSTVIAYRSDKLDKLDLTISDWQDLWHPQLRDRISVLDSPRETIGLTLKKLGYSYNTDNLNSVGNLERELSDLHQQVKLYSSDHYLEPLILGDTWAAVGWSTDVLPIVKRYPEIEFVIPTSGVSLWADLWIVPFLNEAVATKERNLASVIGQWIDFCWETKSAKQISLFTDGISPILLSIKREELPKDLQDNRLLNSEIIKSEKSEFLLPQTPETQQQYRDLWLKIGQAS